MAKGDFLEIITTNLGISAKTYAYYAGHNEAKCLLVQRHRVRPLRGDDWGPGFYRHQGSDNPAKCHAVSTSSPGASEFYF